MITRRLAMAGAAALALPRPADAQTMLAGSALQGDVAVLRRAFEIMHPGLLRYNSASEMSARFDQLARDWGRDQSRREAYLSLSRFLSTIRCGHTYANYFNQTPAVHAELFGGKDKLPFLFRWLEGRMIVTGAGGPDLPPGSEILRINGERPSAILKSLLPLVRADGGNDAARVALLDMAGRDDFESFDIFYGLTRTDAASGFEIEARPAGSRKRVPLNLAPIDLSARREQAVKPPVTEDRAPGWSVTFDAENICTFSMPSWVVYNTKWDWIGFLDQAFADMARRNSPGLIVDLRGNGGGNDCGDEIIARLIDSDLPRPAYERRVRYRKAPDDLAAYLDTWDPRFRNWGDEAQPIDDRFYRLIEADGQSRAPIKPKGPRFRGRMSVIVGPENSSATFQFAALVKREKLGVLVGAPTGGNLRGINGGGFFFMRFPGSGLEVDLPLVGTFPSTPQPDGGVQPDVRSAPTAGDIAAGRDAVMEAARRALA